MKRIKYGIQPGQLDLSVACESCIFERELVQSLHEVLAKVAPRWLGGLRIKAPESIDLAGKPWPVLYETLNRIADQKGPAVQAWERQTGKKAPRGGLAELRGADDSFVLVLRGSESRFQRVGESWIYANTAAFQVIGNDAGSDEQAAWVRNVLQEFVERIPVMYGRGNATEEYAAKNISREGGGLSAVGVDIQRGFPGLYWLNFWGAIYERLLAGVHIEGLALREAKQIAGRGMLVMLESSPWTWKEPDRRGIEEAVRSRLGESLFFSGVENRPRVFEVTPDSIELVGD